MFYVVMSQYSCNIEIVVLEEFYTNMWRWYRYWKYYCHAGYFVILVFVVQIHSLLNLLFFLGGEVSGCDTKPDPVNECLNMLHHYFLQSEDSVERVCWPVELIFLTQKFTTVFRQMKQINFYSCNK